jgi:hypothetical protein
MFKEIHSFGTNSELDQARQKNNMYMLQKSEYMELFLHS